MSGGLADPTDRESLWLQIAGEDALAPDALHDQILSAHEVHDAPKLVRLYQAGAAYQYGAGDLDAALFLTTQAYVFALESGHENQDLLRDLLAAYGREAPA